MTSGCRLSAPRRRPAVSRRQAARRGVTLIELLLVLGLLVVMGSLASPVIDNSFLTARLRRGGDRVLAAWSKARLEAIESGEVMQFTFEPGGSSFRVTAWDPVSAQGGATGVPVGASAGAVTSSPLANRTAGPGSSPTAAMAKAEESLPAQITFHDGNAVVVNADDRQRELTSLSAAGGGWSTPILFFPDGSTTDAAITLATDRKQYQRVTLRGLTGVGRASLIMGGSELQRMDAAGRSAR